jgi:hypothetical protein
MTNKTLRMVSILQRMRKLKVVSFHLLIAPFHPNCQLTSSQKVEFPPPSYPSSALIVSSAS